MRKNYFKNTGIAVVAAAMVLGAAGTAMAEESTATASAPGVFGGRCSRGSDRDPG